MKQLFVPILTSLAALATAASMEPPRGAALIFNYNEIVYVPSAEEDNPAYRVFEEPKPISRAVVQASPRRYQNIAGTGLYKCVLYWPEINSPSIPIQESREMEFGITQYDLELGITVQILASGVICYLLPNGNEQNVAVWVNGEGQGELGKIHFVKLSSSIGGDGDNPGSAGSGSRDGDATMFEGGPQALTDAYIVDWTGQGDYSRSFQERVYRQPFCRLIQQDGRSAGFTRHEPLEGISGTFVGIACGRR